MCHEVEYKIEYNGNKYKHFFEYHDPYSSFKHVKQKGAFDSPPYEPTKRKYISSYAETLKDFPYCKALIKENPTFPYSH